MNRTHWSMLLALALAAPASANPIPLTDWINNGPVTVGLNTFTYQSGLANFPAGTSATVDFGVQEILGEQFTTLDLVFGPALTDISAALTYTVELNAVLPGTFITELLVDSETIHVSNPGTIELNELGAPFTIFTTYYDGTGGVKGDQIAILNSSNGDIDHRVGVFGRYLWVEWTAEVPALGTFVLSRNGYYQAAVLEEVAPEPGALVLATMGAIAALAVLCRRRQRLRRRSLFAVTKQRI